MSPSSSGPRVTVVVDEPTTATGGALSARVTVSGELDEKVRGLRVELLYVNEYLYRRRRSGTSGSRSGTSISTGSGAVDFLVDDNGNDDDATVIDTAQEDVIVQTIGYPLDHGPITGERTVELWVPEQAPPTAGQLVRWKVRAVIDRARGGDVNAEARVVVQSARAGGAAHADDPPKVDDQLEISLSDRAVRPGDTVSGVLVVKPGKTVKFTDIRVEIQAHRRDQDGISEHETIAGLAVSGKTQVEGGERTEFPFALQVPVDAMPSFTADKNELRYAFVASGARRLKLDYNANAGLYLFNGDDEG